MKNKITIKDIAVQVLILILAGLAVYTLMMLSAKLTLAEPGSQAAMLELKVGETRTITVSKAYNWTITDGTVANLKAERAVETATVTGLKPGITTVSVGTSVGQVMAFTYTVVDKTDPGGGDGGGSNPGGGTEPVLLEIPGLNAGTPEDTVLDINGSRWIVIKNMEMEGGKYAMLLKETAISHINFETLGTSYKDSSLQKEFTAAYTDSHIPAVLMNNAVVPNLGNDSKDATSLPTSKMASSQADKTDIIFPLSYKEAFDWGKGTPSNKLYFNSQRWWLRTPDATKWYYVMTMTSTSPNQGSIISSPTSGLTNENLYLRPAIWVKYDNAWG